MIGTIYCLINRVDGSILYVGSTTLSIKERFSNHKSLSKSGCSPIYKWIRENSVSIKYRILKKGSFKNKNHILQKERFFILKLLKEGHPIKNKAYSRTNKYKSIKVDSIILYDTKVICVIKKVSISDYITEAVRKENAKMKQKT